jgi:hypothetical protein
VYAHNVDWSSLRKVWVVRYWQECRWRLKYCGMNDVVASQYSYWQDILPVTSASGSLGCVTSMKIQTFSYGKEALCKVFMLFVLLMNRMKCWSNTSLQVLKNAPALHTLVISHRNDVARSLEFLFPIHGYLSKLILRYCNLSEDGSVLLANIAALYPDLEGLSLEGCCQLSSVA